MCWEQFPNVLIRTTLFSPVMTNAVDHQASLGIIQLEMSRYNASWAPTSFEAYHALERYDKDCRARYWQTTSLRLWSLTWASSVTFHSVSGLSNAMSSVFHLLRSFCAAALFSNSLRQEFVPAAAAAAWLSRATATSHSQWRKF